MLIHQETNFVVSVFDKGIPIMKSGWLFMVLAMKLLGLSSIHVASGQETQTRTINSEATLKLELPPGKVETVPYRGLDASLYMLMSAEYKASCRQCFRWATVICDQKKKSIALKGATSPKPLAVVMDLDETILDNGWFQSQQIRDKVSFDMSRWSKWEDEGDALVRPIPGALEFLNAIREMGIEPVYITNRNDRARLKTKKVLQRLGIDVPDDQLLCSTETTGSDKSSRRAQIESRFQICVYLGDNLRDFDERFRYDPTKGAKGRDEVVEQLAEKFGSEWIILPNPSYGEWTKSFQNDERDVDLLYR